MLQTLKNAWRTKEIRGKILFTLFILLLYRIGTVVPVPFVDASSFASNFNGTILQYMDVLSGGSLGATTLFALGVSPYINSSIIIQLLSVVFPKLGELAKNDKKKMGFITRIVTVALAIVTGVGYYLLLSQSGGALAPEATKGVGKAYVFYAIVIISCYVAGACLIMWLADRINERGIGNGISMILFANIVATLPAQVYEMLQYVVIPTFTYPKPVWYVIVALLFALGLLAVVLALTVFVIFVTGSERRIPVQYSKRVVGRKMYGGQNTHLPIKLNMTGVMPVIFASSIVSLIPTVLAFFGIDGDGSTGRKFWENVAKVLGSNGVIYPIALLVLIIGFAYFYTTITFDPTEVANNLKKQGGTIRGIREGRPTAEYIRKILNKITLAGALFLAIVAVVPAVAGPHLVRPLIEWILKGIAGGDTATLTSYASTFASQAQSLASTFTFGGTSLIIVVGVALETFRDLEAQLTMRSYKGFLN
ncbi:MAG: preprotein translocase subunit SecY [Clostridia bacterium]|nr:preprotein translocase subunit SecY [Clostridia bacterium]